MKKKLIWQLYFSYLVLIVLSLATVLFYTSSLFSEIFFKITKDELFLRNSFVRAIISEVNINDSSAISSLLKRFEAEIRARVTLIALDGTVIADTEKNSLSMENHSNREEFIEAVSKGIGVSERYSTTLNKDMVYTAVKTTLSSGETVVVRTAMPLKDISVAAASLYTKNFIAALIIAIVAALIAFFVSNRINNQLKILQNGAARFSTGDLKHKLPSTNIEEIDRLSNAMNFMAEELSARIGIVTNEKNKLAVVLSSMVEGVIACDSNYEVIEINSEAKKMFMIDIENVVGLSVKDVVRNNELIGIIRDTLTSEYPVEREFSIPGTNGVRIEAKGTKLKNEKDETIGALIVLHDITKIARLESMRRDFVSNVSHELKTPITSIKGYIETLLDGAINDTETAKNFLQIISKQTSRLNAIIEDLLSLSRIEQEEEKRQLEMQTIPIKIIVDSAIQNSKQQAEMKNIAIKTELQNDLLLKVNSNLMEQAISNLIDNAVKYCNNGSVVTVKSAVSNDKISISVADNGPGIPEEHLDRIFERFYRVDKARSRKAGGTGLGLAIVKHIVQAHGGTVSVESKVGLGSTFTINLPNKKT